MKVRNLKEILENYEDDSEIEVEIYDIVSDECIDSTFDIGFTQDKAHPVLVISTDGKSKR